MNETIRGKIRDKDKAMHVRDYSGLRYGRITPTDIDGFLDFGGTVFVFLEIKHGGSEPPRGQLLALERLCDACESATRKSYLIIASHSTPEDEEIDAANSIVIRVRCDKKWYTRPENETVKQCIDAIRKKNGLDGPTN